MAAAGSSARLNAAALGSTQPHGLLLGGNGTWEQVLQQGWGDGTAELMSLWHSVGCRVE